MNDQDRGQLARTALVPAPRTHGDVSDLPPGLLRVKLFKLARRWPRLHRGVHRIAPVGTCPVCKAVWRQLEALPGFNEDLRKAERELETGKGTRWIV